MDDGELTIKYINYNGGIDKYFNIYINNSLVYRDDSDHSITKIKTFSINKGENIITFEYIIDNNLASKGNNYDDDSYLEIFEIQMIKAEVSSLECKNYDSLEKLKNTIHNNCDYYVNKCTNDIYCTFRFYSEIKSEYCNILEGIKNISYTKIPGSICTELISPTFKEVECEHCTYGQYLLKNDENEAKCEYCNNNNYNTKLINDEGSCEEICDIDKKQLNKILYINSFEDQSQYNIDNINIILTIGYIEVNYERFNEKEDCNIFVEINDLVNHDYKTIELINPNEEPFLTDNYNFNIPIQKGSYNIKIKGKNLKINKISVKGTENGGNYKCVDKLNIKDEETCTNDDEYYSTVENKCVKCANGSDINTNKKCIFIQQFIDNKFILDNTYLLNSNIMTNSYEMISSEGFEYYLYFNSSFPLIYYLDNDKNTFIIGKELYKVKLVKGINKRGIILSYLSKDNNKKYITNLFIECNKTSSDDKNVILNNYKIENDTYYYFFSLQSNITCPYCLNSEVTYIMPSNSKCQNNQELVDIKINDSSLCVIKPYDNSNTSKLENDINILLNFNSTEIEDKLLFEYYEINENIPINYEKDDDEINTLYQKYISCEYNRKSITEMGTGIIILIIIAGVFLVFLIGIIIWKIVDISKQKKMPERINQSLIELQNENKIDDNENLDNENQKFL